MVRSVIAFLPAVLATESVLMQSQASSDGSLALESANDHMMEAMHAGSSRVEKMQQNTQAMEDQYRALLQNIVTSGSLTDPDTGKPWLPSASGLALVDSQFDALKKQLEGEKTSNQAILTAALAAITKCNTDRSTAFGSATTPGTVLALQKTSADDRSSHSSCRGQEDSEIKDMED